jgi:hypothetical protein
MARIWDVAVFGRLAGLAVGGNVIAAVGRWWLRPTGEEAGFWCRATARIEQARLKADRMDSNAA